MIDIFKQICYYNYSPKGKEGGITMSKEDEILNNMRLLQISREEAEQLYIDDHSDEVLPEVAEIEKKAKEMGRRYEKSETAKKTSKEKKLDDEKVTIIADIADALKNNINYMQELEIKNPQREITFVINENEYSITLTKHRNKK
jgi:hypothetical protein